MKWSDEYLVNHPLIDQQHQHLFTLILEIEELCTATPAVNLASIQHMSNVLLDYASTHFSTEEAFLQDIRYPMADLHAECHKQYAEQMVEIMLNSIQGRVNLQALVLFLKEWWYEHILCEDQLYRAYCSHQKHLGGQYI